MTKQNKTNILKVNPRNKFKSQNTDKMSNRNTINEFANKAVRDASPNEIDILYRMINFLCDITERSREVIHITDRERHHLFRSLIETKQAIIKSINKDPAKFNAFLNKMHLPEN